MKGEIRLEFVHGSMSFEFPVGDDLEGHPAGEPCILRSLTLSVGGQPIMSAPFHMHPDGKRYHTICRRESAEIDSVDW